MTNRDLFYDRAELLDHLRAWIKDDDDRLDQARQALRPLLCPKPSPNTCPACCQPGPALSYSAQYIRLCKNDDCRVTEFYPETEEPHFPSRFVGHGTATIVSVQREPPALVIEP